MSVTSGSPKNCKVENFAVTPIAIGACQLILAQTGNELTLPAQPVIISIDFKPECTMTSRETGNGSFATATCFVVTRSISSTSSDLASCQDLNLFMNSLVVQEWSEPHSGIL